MLNHQRVHDFSYLGKELPPQNWRIRSRQLVLSLVLSLTWGKSPKSMCFGWSRYQHCCTSFFLDRTDLKKSEDSLVPFPLACWQDFVFGDEEEQRLQVLKELHVLWNFSDAQGAEDRVESENHWELGNWGCVWPLLRDPKHFGSMIGGVPKIIGLEIADGTEMNRFPGWKFNPPEMSRPTHCGNHGCDASMLGCVPLSIWMRNCQRLGILI